MPFIALKNLQKERICHAPMTLANGPCGMLKAFLGFSVGDS
jgi:hypothetical protein